MSQTHQNNFDFIRFAAATMVWFYHCYALTGQQDPLNRIIAFESFGGLGVAIFFVVSGYFITASYEHHDTLVPFMRNRILRIMPALIALVLLSIFILGPLCTTLSLSSYFRDAQTWHYLKNILIFPLQYDLPGVFQDHKPSAVNGSLWTLQHEARCYFVIALFGVLGILQPRVMTALFLAFAAFLAYDAFCGTSQPEKFLTFRWEKIKTAVHLGFLFSGGALVYMFRGVVPRHIGFLTGCFLLIVLSTRLSDRWGTMLFDLAMIYSVIYLGFLRLPMLPEFGRFGDFSYGMYIYSFPMQQLTLNYVHGHNSSFGLFMAVSFLLTLACAVASWHLVEKPALRHKS